MADKKFNQVPLGTPESGDRIPGLKSDGITDVTYDAGEYLTGLISATYAEATASIGSNELLVGKYYNITDKGVIIKATTNNTFSLEGSGKFIVPDYGLNSVWVSLTGGGAYLVNDKAIYNGLVWNNDTGTNTDTAPPSDGANWSQVATTDATNYNTEWDYVHYDFPNDRIILREDIRGNHVSGSTAYINSNDPIGLFQWGNDSVTGNFVQDSYMSILNQAGTVTANTFLGGSTTGAWTEGFSGSFIYNQVYNQSSINLVNGTTGAIQGCIFGNQSTFVMNGQTNNIIFCTILRDISVSSDIGSHTEKRAVDEESTFEKTIDMSNTITTFPSITTLTITGNVTSLYKSGDTIEIVGSTSNDGTYTLSIDSTFGAGVTTLTITTTWIIEAAVGSVTGQILDISDSGGFIGVVEIQADADVDVYKILNMSTSNPVTFYPENGRVITFVHKSVATASTDEITLEGGSDLSITGRATQSISDFLQVREGAYIRQLNATTLQ